MKETMAMGDVTRAIRMGMVGGGVDAFIGNVHRVASRLDESMTLVAGALSSTPERSVASGLSLGLDEDRCYATWQDMLTCEAARAADERIEVVVIVTPNHVHFPVAKAALEAGFHVVCDKPMVCTIDESNALVAAQQASGRVFAVTYNYTGYPMVKQMRAMVRSGEIGSVRKVMVEYLQGWLATPLEQTGQKQAAWRSDPTKAGAGAIGDIGSHAENIMAYVTGLELSSVNADVATLVPGRVLDDDVSALLRFENGATGVLAISQVCPGCRNGLRLRVWGETGGLEWAQESPNALLQTSLDGPDIVHRLGDAGLCDTAGSRLPGGHPEGFIEAFAALYKSVAAAIHAGRDDGDEFDYPDVHAGARGVQFIAGVISDRA
ncbi:MAG: Gfo/Idh/MocA family oxidoreductase [Phycisphaerales bacterium]|nr:Gfo/Idh/MocA family oxidoreductase [Phycisphaerales bacterium]